VPTPAQSSTILSARDLQFMLFEWLDVERLSERPRYADHDRDSYEALLALCEELATDRFAPHYRRSDTEEPTFDGEKVHLIPEIATALEAFAKADLLTLTLDEDMGGHQVPHVVAAACMAWFTAANIGTAAYSFLTMANAALLLAHGTPDQVDRYARPMLEGRFFGTMTLSEPHAGSSLGDVTTRAVPAHDGTYRIFGSKMWISGGDHEMGDNIVHLVLAKLPDAPDGTSWTRTARSGSATMSRWPASTTSSAAAARSTRLRSSAAVPSRRAAPRARSATSSGSRTAACPTCST
jgi:alkylation response protein AidB-like acyl-CoA dehydrogenase